MMVVLAAINRVSLPVPMVTVSFEEGVPDGDQLAELFQFLLALPVQV